jgi:hypothetical protein
MRKSIVAAAGVAAVLAFTLPAAKAAAMPVAAPDQLGFPSGMANGVEKTVLVCGPWACYWRPGFWGVYRPYPYWGWRRHYWWGWHRPGWGWGWRRPGWGWGRPWGWRRW